MTTKIPIHWTLDAGLGRMDIRPQQRYSLAHHSVSSAVNVSSVPSTKRNLTKGAFTLKFYAFSDFVPSELARWNVWFCTKRPPQ